MKILLRKINHRFYIIYLKYIRHPWEGYKFRKKANLTYIDILPKNANYYLCIVAIFRGEDDYLEEWIGFNKLMGVEHFILYDNGLDPNSKVLLQKYIDDGSVTHILFPDIDGLRDGKHADTLSIQQLAYADCIIRFRKKFKYLLQLDIDEFLFPIMHNSITEILKEFDDSKLSRIEVNWTNFGDSGYNKKPNGLVIENFIKTGINIVNQTVKSISNSKYLSRRFVYTNVHRFSHRFSIIDMITKAFIGYPFVIKGKKANNLFQLNHYITKSKEEYSQKLRINKKGYMVGKETDEMYIELNKKYNEIKNTEISRFVPILKSLIVDIK